jgi:hypothetical protein
MDYRNYICELMSCASRLFASNFALKTDEQADAKSSGERACPNPPEARRKKGEANIARTIRY